MDGSGTVATDDRFFKSKKSSATIKEEDEESPSSDDSNENDAAPINENLFLDEDLEGLDDELNELDLDP